MNKLDDGAISRSRRLRSAAADNLAQHQRQVIFAAFGRRESAGGVIVSLPGHLRQHHTGPGAAPDNIVDFPARLARRRKA